MNKVTVHRILPNGRVVVEDAQGKKRAVANPHNIAASEGMEVNADHRQLLQVVTYKADIWRRATEQEVLQLTNAIDEQSLKNQLIFRDASFIDHFSEEFQLVTAIVEATVGVERAEELLAPSISTAYAD